MLNAFKWPVMFLRTNPEGGMLWFVLQVAEVSHLDDEIMALHSEIVELQRSPYARRQGDKMEQLWVFMDSDLTSYLQFILHSYLNVADEFHCREEKAIELYKQLKMKCKSKKHFTVPEESKQKSAVKLMCVFIR